jgi:hypothetical protein
MIFHETRSLLQHLQQMAEVVARRMLARSLQRAILF